MPRFAPIGCAGATFTPPTGALPTGTSCNSNIAPGNRTRGGAFCLSATHVCYGRDAVALAPCAGKANGTAVRLYDTYPLSEMLATSLATTLSLPGLQAALQGDAVLSPRTLSALLSEVSICEGAGCNSVAADGCALDTVPPVVAQVVLSGLPAEALDSSTGKLTPTAVGLLTSALAAAVQLAAGCPTCGVDISRVTETGTGRVLFSAAGRRRAQALTSGVSVDFSVSGGSTSALASVTASTSSSSSSSFFSAVATNLASNGGGAYASVTASKPPATQSSARKRLELLGLLALLVLVVGAPLAWCRYKRTCCWGHGGSSKLREPAPGMVLRGAAV